MQQQPQHPSPPQTAQVPAKPPSCGFRIQTGVKAGGFGIIGFGGVTYPGNMGGYTLAY
jgi:hypothetical protein